MFGLAVVGTGCASPADNYAQQASVALDRCDVRTARTHFGEAHAADATHAQGALGYALTELAFLAESDDAAALLAPFGVTQRIDVQSLMFGDNGLLARLSRHDTCASVTEFLRTQLPNATMGPSTTPGVPGMPTMTFGSLSPTVRGEQLRAPIAALATRLGNIAAALETAGRSMGNGADVNLHGCGAGTPTRLQAPEILAGAASLELVRATIEVALAYDWDLPLRTATQRTQGDVDSDLAVLNAHLFHLREPAHIQTARAALERALLLTADAATAAESAPAGVANAVIDWSAIPDERLEELRRVVVSVRASLEGPTAVADVTPALTLDLGAFFAHPPDASTLSGPLFVAEGTSNGRWIHIDDARVRELLSQAIAWPEAGRSYHWTPSDAWSSDATRSSVRAAFAPLGRQAEQYSCRP